MSISVILKSVCHQLTTRRAMLYSAGAWTALLILTVSIASFSPELAFVLAISLSSPYSRSCNAIGYVRLPLDLPGDKVCLPAHMMKRSSVDVFIPTMFAALIVASSALVLRSLCFSQN